MKNPKNGELFSDNISDKDRSYKSLIHYQRIIAKSEKCCVPESKINKSDDMEMFV